jgi:hypothetical protein
MDLNGVGLHSTPKEVLHGAADVCLIRLFMCKAGVRRHHLLVRFINQCDRNPNRIPGSSGRTAWHRLKASDLAGV